MRPPSIGIAVTRPVRISDSSAEVPEPFQDVEISGNRLGLLQLAEMIRRIADAEEEDHTHVYPDDEPRLLRTSSFSLTISKNSIK